MSRIVVCALYKWVTLENFKALRQPLHDVMEDNHVRGTLLLASEGINGTVAGFRPTIVPSASSALMSIPKTGTN